jgi:hypothetical protein
MWNSRNNDVGVSQPGELGPAISEIARNAKKYKEQESAQFLWKLQQDPRSQGRLQ